MQITIHDIKAGTVVTRDATAAEVAQATADNATAKANQDAIAAQISQRAADLATVKAAATTDPKFAALARLLGA